MTGGVVRGEARREDEKKEPPVVEEWIEREDEVRSRFVRSIDPFVSDAKDRGSAMLCRLFELSAVQELELALLLIRRGSFEALDPFGTAGPLLEAAFGCVCVRLNAERAPDTELERIGRLDRDEVDPPVPALRR